MHANASFVGNGCVLHARGLEPSVCGVVLMQLQSCQLGIRTLFFMQLDVFDGALCVRNESRVGMLLMAGSESRCVEDADKKFAQVSRSLNCLFSLWAENRGWRRC